MQPCVAASTRRPLPRVPQLCFPAQTALYQGLSGPDAGAASSAFLPPPLAVFLFQLLRGQRSCFSCLCQRSDAALLLPPDYLFSAIAVAAALVHALLLHFSPSQYLPFPSSSPASHLPGVSQGGVAFEDVGGACVARGGGQVWYRWCM